MKILKVNYNQADIERMHGKNVLAHHALYKIPANEIYKNVRKSIASELSACGREKTLELNKLIVKLEGMEADRLTNELSNIQSGRTYNNRNNRVQSQNMSDIRCFICGQQGHTRHNCTSPCKWCGEPGHKYADCKKWTPENRYRGRS